jgi:glucokinase
MPIRKLIQERFGCTTYLGNDANVAALAEAMRGAAQGYKYVIYLTISTGIGSGIIDNGRLVVGAHGLGGEAGHMMMVVNGEVMDLEHAASGTGIARQGRERLQDGAPSRIRDLVGGKLENVTAKTVGEAAKAGDPLAIELIKRAGYMVGLGIVSLLHVFNPQIIVVGGGVTKTGELLFAPMREAVHKHVLDPDYCDNLPIVQAALGDDVALVGAAALVRTRGGSYL